MELLDVRTYDRVLVVTAHPDDVDFLAAGTVARLTDAGADVAYLVVTDGQAGGFERDRPREEIPTVRREEQRAAAAAVGVDEVAFLGLVDGEVVADLELARAISRAIRQHRPQLVITWSPERNYRQVGASHPDHRAVGDATLDAVYPFARNPFAFPELLDAEGLDAWIVDEVWLKGAEQPDVAVDVTATMDRKLAAVSAHASQLSDTDETARRVRGWATDVAASVGLPDGACAEAFRRIAFT